MRPPGSGEPLDTRGTVEGYPQLWPYAKGDGRVRGRGQTPGSEQDYTSLRRRITQKFLKDLASDYYTHGASAIELARHSDPMKYIQMVAGLLPKEIEVKGPMDNMSDDDLLLFIDRLRSVVVTQQVETGAGQAPEPEAP